MSRREVATSNTITVRVGGDAVMRATVDMGTEEFNPRSAALCKDLESQALQFGFWLYGGAFHKAFWDALTEFLIEQKEAFARPRNKSDWVMTPCACGCGQEIGYPPQYLRGHKARKRLEEKKAVNG
jgi:hypothetical protein